MVYWQLMLRQELDIPAESLIKQSTQTKSV